MQLSSLLLALCLAGSSAAQRRVIRRDDALPSEEDKATPKRFIVEFPEGVDSTSALDALTSVSGAKVLKVFDSDVFRGAALESEEDNVDSLQALAPVAQAWVSRRIKLSPVTPQVLGTDAESAHTDIHYMTGVDKLHEAGILGKGVTVGVVDTGVAYNHPALGGGFGPGFKVAGGYDFVGDGEWPIVGEKEPDSDPQDQQGHGTHVSGIIAGKTGNFTGVAPEATILSYKVFTSIDNTDEDTLIDAFLRAYEDGADIITSSIGGASGFTTGAWALVASRLVEQGVVVTISAGNSGAEGSFVASSGSSGANVLAIASVNAATIFAPTFTLNVDANSSTIPYLTSDDDWVAGVADGLPIVPLTLDSTVAADACSALPDTTPDFTGKIALVRRGTCTFATKQANLAPFNAKYILFYTTPTSSLTAPGTDDHSSLVAMIQADAGAAIIDAYKAGANITGTFLDESGGNVSPIDNPIVGGLASSFTSIGPTNDLFIKPDVAAPGGSIFSTWLNDGWSVLSGTSMACPYVAGVAALYIGQFGGRKTHGPSFAKDLAARIMTSGENIPWDTTAQVGGVDGAISSVAQVGTGLINATKVLSYDTQLSYSKFALNDTHHFSRYHSVDVTNTGKASITYTFELEGHGGFYSLLTDAEIEGAPRMATFGEVLAEPTDWVPTVSLPSSFTLAPGQTKTAKVSFNYPQGLDGTRIPVYSGKILVKGSNGEVLSVPYLGVASDLHKDVGTMFEYASGAPSITSTPTNISIADKATFTFDLSVEAQDFPSLWTILKFGTTQLRWDIFEETWKERDWVYPPVVGQAGYVGSATAWAGDTSSNSIFDPAKDDANFLATFPQVLVPRDYASGNGTAFWWLGQLANGTRIAPGKYKFRVAALVPFGTPEHSDNWDVFQTPAIEVLN